MVHSLRSMPPPIQAGTLGAHLESSSAPPEASAAEPVPPEQPEWWTSSFFSQLTFSYFYPLLRLGVRNHKAGRPLEERDIFAQRPHEHAARCEARFNAEWDVQCTAARAAARAPSLLRACLRAFGRDWLIAQLLALAWTAFLLTSPFFVRALLRKLDQRALPADKRDGGGTGLLALSEWELAVGLLLCQCFASLCFQQMCARSIFSGTQARSGLMCAIYAKSLRLTSGARQSTTGGAITNVMSADVERIFRLLQYGFGLAWTSVTMITVVLVFIVLEVGVAGTAGIALIALLLPCEMRLATLMARYRRRMLVHSDARVKLIAELLAGIRVVKQMAWERPLAAHVQRLRDREMAMVARASFCHATNTWLVYVSTPVMCFVLFWLYDALGNDLDVPTVFAVIAFLNTIRFPASVLPTAIDCIAEAFVSHERIRHFLTLPDLPQCARFGCGRGELPFHSAVDAAGNDSGDSNDDDASIEVVVRARRANFYWTQTDGDANDNANGITQAASPPAPVPLLRDIDLTVRRGQLVAVVGQVGSGKSSLLQMMLGEMTRSSGELSISDGADVTVAAAHRWGATESSSRGSTSRRAYVGQQPWIMNGTLVDNIRFFHPDAEENPACDEVYQRVLRASLLLPDLAALPAGDATEIGERGINLSGGQKARVALARAMYRAERGDSDFFLLDDPLAAVDAESAHALFEGAIAGLLGGHTRVLVVNAHLELCRRCDLTVVMEQGRVVAAEHFDDVLATGRFEWMRAYTLSEEQAQKDGKEAGLGQMEGHARKETEEGRNETEMEASRADDNQTEQELAQAGKPVFPVNLPLAAAEAGADGSLTTVEDRVTGVVRPADYLFYFGCAAPNWAWACAAFLLASYGGAEALRVASDWTLGEWADTADDGATVVDATATPANATPQRSDATAALMTRYAALVWAAVVMVLMRAWFTVWLTVRASQNLHRTLFSSMLRAHVTHFFDVTPIGRIVNRFSADMDKIDQMLPRFFIKLVETLAELIGVLIICLCSSPWFFLIMLPPAVLFWKLTSIYRCTNREIKRLEGVTKSPVFSLFSETLNGLVTIRAFGMEGPLTARFRVLVDASSKMYWAYYTVARWLATRLEALAYGIQFMVTSFCILDTRLDPVTAGMALVYTLQITNKLQSAVRQTVEVESCMTAVERLRYYAECPMEKEYHELAPTASGYGGVASGSGNGDGNGGAVDSSWPPTGSVVFEDCRMRYRPGLPEVLCGLSLRVRGGEKVGWCGRTGAGKSSVMVALLRMVELSGGRVFIDSVDIASVALTTLRSRVSIIPQDPVLFSGTIRENLLPDSRVDDATLWQVLVDVHLADRLRGKGKLDAIVAEHGTNFSVGEKQLLCIARALLRKSKIILMDEATASIDAKTDALIQQLVRERFKSSTVLTIAHRLNTIVEYDTIVVVDGGQVVETGTPLELLQPRAGCKLSRFGALVAEMGEDMASAMLAVARRKERQLC